MGILTIKSYSKGELTSERVVDTSKANKAKSFKPKRLADVEVQSETKDGVKEVLQSEAEGQGS